jgi:DNA polymerase-1
MHSDLGSQFQKAYDVLDSMQIPIYKLPGYEADDVIGTVATQAKNMNEVVIVTGDRDILQLVDDNRVRIYMPVKGLEGKLYGEAEVEERMHVTPEQIIDYKALAGDPSDNYPGVAGIGPKTASNLLNKYQTLENIYKHLDELPEKLAKRLAEGAEPAGIAKKLATIVCDAPITFHEKDAEKWDVDHPNTLKLFEQIGFKTLTSRVQKVGQEIDKEKQMKLI